ncbi:DUF2141 domain-containing protein [Fibrella aquatilis]|uniref:DUF2141 domain-containing protein n=1 Tax=Fibrella aquatilis TaxID=2817059 RepID=A0A939G9P4_9BACT|nr:DUF2141 domain-containing protein [Fibrella aquatilis]MBO0932880.1 DUF2141 domain-containing protein [Fibrella aquatilis]
MTNTILVFLLTWLGFGAFAQTGTVVVIIEGVQPTKGGELTVGIFRKDNFPKVGKQFVGTEKPATTARIQVLFADVPVGDYGVVAFQDIDKNKLLKSNFLGFPTEPIGFSRGAKIKFGPPAFEDAKVTVEANKTLTVNIVLN